MSAHLLPGSKNFQVIEEPAYLPNGSGEHLYVDIEKESLTTDQVAEALAKACGKKERDVGYGGRKDRHAVTRQWFSVHFGKDEALATLQERLPHGRVQVHGVARHANKLRLGHLAGNRFVLGIAGDTTGLAERLAKLAHEGIRNRFGAQRFGLHGATLALAGCVQQDTGTVTTESRTVEAFNAIDFHGAAKVDVQVGRPGLTVRSTKRAPAR